MDYSQPIVARHNVSVGDLFFSTTDDRGVITQANSVFERMSRYPMQALLGAPHNIIRHPNMPGGAFKVMWDTLNAGRPFCAYVDNLAADGSTYTVFATITPTRGGYLSVRCRPMNDALNETAHAIYAQARPVELEARAQGASAAESARIGVQKIVECLNAAGISSYEQITLTSLPQEVELLLGVPTRRPYLAPEGPLNDRLRVSDALSHELTTWLTRMKTLADVADRLSSVIPQLDASVEASQATANHITETTQDSGFSTSVIYLRVWSDISAMLEPILRNLSARLAELSASCAETRFQIALALLHNRTVNQFIVEGLDQSYWPDAHRRALDSLASALHDDIARADDQSQSNVRFAAAAGS